MESSNAYASSLELCFCLQEKNAHIRKYVLDHSQLLKKKLTNSDLNVNLNRLLLNRREAEEQFLPLLGDHDDIEKGVPVCAYDNYGNIYSLTFKKWTNKYYILNGDWRSLFQSHKLQKNDTISMWMFIHSSQSKLCLAIEYEKNEK